MSKVLKRLYLGDVVANGTTKRLRKLTSNITFTVGVTSYTVAPNTTWEEWANSTNLEITDDGHIRLSGGYTCVALLNGTLVNSTDIILENGEYGWLDSEWIGVWYVNDVIAEMYDETKEFAISGSFYVIDSDNWQFSTQSLVKMSFSSMLSLVSDVGMTSNEDHKLRNNYYVNGTVGDYSGRVIYTQWLNDFSVIPITNANAPTLRTFTITGGADINNEDFVTALRANATRVTS